MSMQEWLPDLQLFRKGERLIVAPSGTDDAEALNHQGEACIFQRMSPHGFAIVRMLRFGENGRNFYFRAQDLKREGES